MLISMTILLLVPLVITIMLMSFFAINSLTNFYNRLIVVVLMVSALSISFVSFNTLLSQPKLAQFEWFYRQIEKVEVVSAIIVNEEAIYIWAMFPGENKPRYYEFDWNKKQAEQLQKAMSEKRRGKRGKIMMKRPFRHDYDNGVAKPEDIIIFDPLPKQLPNKIYEKR